MRDMFQTFVDSRVGRACVGALLLAGCVGIYSGASDAFGGSHAASLSRDRAFICAETLLVFEHTVKLGDTFPVNSPYSGKPTGYQAEACYWTADGQVKREPTWVLLNTHNGMSGPTYCPDCGRRVTEMNNPPIEGQTPPPTRTQLARR